MGEDRGLVGPIFAPGLPEAEAETEGGASGIPFYPEAAGSSRDICGEPSAPYILTDG